MSEVDSIFEVKNDRRLFFKLRDWIFENRCRPLESYASYAPRLSEGERYVILAWGFVAEVTNGGLHQFLTNSTGDHTEETREAMRQIGATLAAEALEGARKVFFGNQPVPAELSVRCNIMSNWEKQHGQQQACDYLDNFDRALGHCETVENAIVKYTREHREMFG